jgi:hypothetical protein
LDGEFQRTVSLGIDDSLPVFSGGLWTKEPNTSWSEDLLQSLVFELEFQSAAVGDTLSSQIAALDWGLTSAANSGDMSQIQTVINAVFVNWEAQREKILQVDREATPGQANWETAWLSQGESLPIPDGVRLFWRQPSQGFSGQWEVRSGAAHRKDRYTRGSSEYYTTAVVSEDFFKVNEFVNDPIKGNWWVDDDDSTGPFPQPSEFTFTLHRPAYLRVSKTRLRDLGANVVTDSFYFTVDGHHLIARSSMDDQNAPDGIRWVPQGRGLTREVESGDKSLILVFDFMNPLLLPPGKHRIRYGWTLGSNTDAGNFIDFPNAVFLSPYTLTDLIRYDYPDYWEFIYA